MRRTLFLVLWLVFAFGSQARAIEIYVNGHKYGSLEAYKAYQRTMTATPVSLGRPLKTLPMGPQDISDATRHQLYVLSVENGMVGALQDFYQAQGQPDFQTPHIGSSEELQEAIQQAVTASAAPKLLIAQPGKLRIMALTARYEDHK